MTNAKQIPKKGPRAGIRPTPPKLDPEFRASKPYQKDPRFEEDAVDRDLKAHPPLPPPIDLCHLLTAEIPRPSELIHGLLHQGSKMVIGGGSKSYKTWTLLDLGISVATGIPWWGFDTEQGKVLYINFEIQDAFFQSRIQDLMDAKDCSVELGQFMYWGLRGYAADFRDLVPQMIELTEGEDLALIIVDPIYKGLGNRDENKAGDIAGLLNEIETLAVQTGAAVAFGHHFSKGNQATKDPMDRIGGSGVFSRDPDTILTMTRHQEDEAFTVEAILRNFVGVDPFVVRRKHPLMVRDDDLNPNELKQAGPSKEKYSDEEILAPLSDEPMTTTNWANDVVDRLGMSASNFMIRRRQLERKGFIRKEGKEWMRVTRPGGKTSFVRTGNQAPL